jgi:predicted nucleic acid-binding protein
MILLDTNLLLGQTSSSGVRGPTSQRSIARLRQRGEQLVIVPQNLFEFWSVATRKPGSPPAGQNGLAFTCNQAAQWTAYFRRRFRLLPDDKNLTDHWLTLVHAFGIRGTKSHDARLVAAMETHKITRILTFNAGDFKKFAITVIDPASV